MDGLCESVMLGKWERASKGISTGDREIRKQN